jgi:hypothetical protein
LLIVALTWPTKLHDGFSNLIGRRSPVAVDGEVAVRVLTVKMAVRSATCARNKKSGSVEVGLEITQSPKSKENIDNDVEIGKWIATCLLGKQIAATCLLQL